jgi:hypothetical protein
MRSPHAGFRRTPIAGQGNRSALGGRAVRRFVRHSVQRTQQRALCQFSPLPTVDFPSSIHCHGRKTGGPSRPSVRSVTTANIPVTHGRCLDLLQDLIDRLLARRRRLHQGQRHLGLPVSRPGSTRSDDRLPSVRSAGRHSHQAILPPATGTGPYCDSGHYYRCHYHGRPGVQIAARTGSF